MGRPTTSGLTAEFSKMLGFSFNTRLGKNLTLWKNAVLNQDIDFCMIVDGPEGGGKSLKGAQIAVFLQYPRDFELEKQVFWNPEKAKEAIRTLPRFSVIMMDEAARMSDRRQSTQQMNIEFNRLLRECRQYNQFLIFVLPSFYDMDMVPAVWRSRALLHIWYDWDLSKPETPLQRGFFRFYNEQGKKDLYTSKHLRQRYEYPYLKNRCFDGTFTHYWPFPHEEYKRLKKEAELTANNPPGRQSCPQCHSVTLYKRATKSWDCRACDWSSPSPEAAGTHKPPVNGKKRASKQ